MIISKYSRLGFSEQLQLESLHCNSSEWRMAVLKGIISGQRLLGKLDAGPLEMTHPQLAEAFDYLTCGALDVVSEEFSNFLAPKVNAEFLPIDMTYRAGKGANRKYFVMHLLDTFDAMDRVNSEYQEYSEAAGGGVSQVTRLIINEETVRGSRAFILNELAVIFFDDQLCSEIIDAGFRGLKFTSQDQFHFG